MSTGIEWTDETWNPTTGCDRVSPGCDNCYALGMAKRLKAMGSADYQTDGDPKTSGPGFGLAIHPHRLDQPLRWKKPRKVFVNSMSDLFHDSVPTEHLAAVFATMAAAPQHTFQILTKRHARMRSLLNGELRERTSVMLASWWDEWGDPRYEVDIDEMWPLPNVWLGVSVENQKWADIRIPELLDTPAAVRFLSCEPLLGPVKLAPEWLESDDDTCTCSDTAGCREIHWLIVGGESGHGARPMHPDWARSLRDQCGAADVPFLFKQWGEWQDGSHDSRTQHGPDHIMHRNGHHVLAHEYQTSELVKGGAGERMGACFISRVGKHAAGRELDGRTWDQYPTAVTA
jgi:protein gp37